VTTSVDRSSDSFLTKTKTNRVPVFAFRFRFRRTRLALASSTIDHSPWPRLDTSLSYSSTFIIMKRGLLKLYRFVLLALLLVVWAKFIVFLRETTLLNYLSSSPATPSTSKTKKHILSELHLDPNGHCQGKERLVEILHAAEQPNITNVTCLSLPTWKEVTELYGDEPVVLGLESCERYRSLLSKQHNWTKPMVRTAGLYNTGTNAFDQSLERNFEELHSIPKHDVPWGKHVEVKYRLKNKYPRGNPEPPHLVLPVVLVKDPYGWMNSMASLYNFTARKLFSLLISHLFCHLYSARHTTTCIGTTTM